MALGTLGSTLNDELNRLANGGTYRDMNQMVDEALAAKQWANRENINPYSTDTVGILNEIAGLGLDKKNWLDFNGVCNYIAGTTGLPAAAALRQVYPTTDLLTGVASYYVDAAYPTGLTSTPGYVYLNGTAGNNMSSPDSSALDITGDIDIRVRVALDDWTPAATTSLLTKYISNANGSYSFYVTTAGNLGLYWVNSSNVGTGVTSTASTALTDGSIKWVRATLDVDNGASGRDIKFFTSDDGTTWTQLGTTVTQAGTTNIFNSTATLQIGSYNTTSEMASGKFFRAQVRNGIDGTVVFDANMANVSLTATSFTESSSNAATVTINGFRAYPQDAANLGAAGSLLPTTLGSSTAADSNDPKFLDFTGTNYVYLPGASGNNLTLPDAAALDITGDIDVRAYVALDDWTPAASNFIISKWGNGSQKSYALSVNATSGVLTFFWTADGSTVLSSSSTVAPTIADGAPLWIRATLDVDNGASGNDTIFYTSTNGTTWTQLGSTVTKAGTTSIFSGTETLRIGNAGIGGDFLAGKVYRTQILNGIGGTTVLDVDTSTLTRGDDAYIVPTTYSGATGAYFTGTGLSLPGTTGNYVSTPDASQLDITGDIDIAVQVALADWTPSSNNMLISKYNSGVAGARSYQLMVGPSGFLNLQWSTDGSTLTNNISSTAANTIPDGTASWVRATLDVNNGASGNEVKFYTSTDGTTWTQLGSTVTTAGVTSIFSGSAQLEIGSRNVGTADFANGTFYRAVVKSGIDGFTVFDATFVGVPANSLRMIESSAYKAVVTLNTTRYCTINRSTSGRKTVAVTQPTWLFGTDDYMEVNNRYTDHLPASENYVYLSGTSGNYMSVSDNPPLDVTGDIDIQVRVALDDWTPASAQVFLAKRNTGQFSYQFIVQPSGVLAITWTTDGATGITANSTVAPTVTDGSVLWVRTTRVSSTGVVRFFTSTNGTNWTQLGADVSSTPSSIYSGTAPVEIGTVNLGTGAPARGRFYRAIIKNGIDGTTVLDANTAVITTPTQTTFTDSSSNAYTVTINRSGVGTFVSTNNYLYLPGVASNYASAPDSAALSITGDIDIRIKVALDDWTPSTQTDFISKWGAGTRSYDLALTTGGNPVLYWSTDGLAGSVKTVTSTVAAGITDGSVKWIRATLDVDNGASGNDVKFFTSDDGSTWTQLGATVTTAGVTSIFDSTADLRVGHNAAFDWPLRGKVFRAQVLNGIGGTVAFDANFETSITSLNQASFTESSANAATVTINRSGSTYRSAGITAAGYLYPGATNTFAASATDFLNFGAADSGTIFIAFRQWATPPSYARYISKQGVTVPSWGMMSNATTLATWSAFNDGSGEINPGSQSFVGGALNSYAYNINRTTNTIQNYLNNVASTTTSISGKGSLANPGTLRIGHTSAGGTTADIEFISAAVFRQVLTAAQIRQITNYFANREVYL